MNRYTEILVGEGGTGKTAELIKKSAESGIYILVANRKRAEILMEQAEDMKLYIPFPVTLREWLRSDNRFHGSSIRRDGLLIDDIDDVIRELFLPIEIKAVTLRTPYVIKNLDRVAATEEEIEIEKLRLLLVGVGDISKDLQKEATKAIKAGYRKQSEGHWTLKRPNCSYYCSCCGKGIKIKYGERAAILWDYCPNCGAKMKGGAE